jgi:ATP-dependent DNA helicase RecQ
MQNSVMQIRNLLGAFPVAGAVASGPVFLLDDMVDSGWTLTLLAILLRVRGSGPVYPVALARGASPKGS